MQNNSFDLEFEISGEQLDDLDWHIIYNLNPTEKEIATSVHKIILKNAWEIISLEELRCQLIKNLYFIDLIKVKLDFGEAHPPKPDKSIFRNTFFDKIYYNTIESLPFILSDNLFGWIYFKENEKIKTFRFILDISTGEIKYLK
jgi:hypothetical protein